ncbi:MAG TPA: histone deacetylase family protein [Candidatus Sulfomarinibacteraceae bacterium]|nr:histone deacetylase family protein [Candidatus Sulfomarinibacteraceae bacterium]
MKVVYTPRHLAHDVTHETYLGLAIPANEVPERAERIRQALADDGGFDLVEPIEHGLDPVLAVHDPGLVRFVEEAWEQARREAIGRSFLVADTYPVRAMFEGMSEAALGRLREPLAIGGRTGWWGLDSGNPLVAGTYEASRWAVDVALTAADLVVDGGESAVYGLCRPPGHHAARAMVGGYCFFNTAAIAAEAIVRRTGGRVAILDLDVHHGNGTQQIFWRREDVFYASIHADPANLYPFYLGYADEVGEGPGAGANYNQPLPSGTGDAVYLEAVDRALDAIARTPGDVLVVSLGFDTYREDPIGTLALTTPVYHEIGRRSAALGRRLVILQEGGYHRPSLGTNARAWLRGAAGRAHVPSEPR